MDETLRRLLSRLLEDIAAHADGATTGRLNGDQFQAAMARTLLDGHLAAYFAGRDVSTLSPQAKKVVTAAVQSQLDYLNPFADQIVAGAYRERAGALAARASLYAGSVKALYSRAQWWDWPLPAYPTQGVPCMNNCACSWHIEVIDAEQLDGDAYWRLGPTEHCTGCKERASRYSPYRIRNGEGAA